MDSLQSELKDLKGFIAELKADREAQKEKERRESWTKYTSLSIVCIAVLAAVATQWAGKYGSRTLVNLNDSTFHQTKASDQWSYYQAKSIKRNLYELARDQAELAPDAGDGRKAKNLASITGKIAKYEQDEKDIQAEAKELERQRDVSRAAATQASKLGGRMGLATSIFQISIAIGSICLVMKKKSLWYLSLLLAALATIEMVSAWVS